MAIKKDEVGVKKETPILKKRTAPEDLKVEKVDSPKPSPLKKRVLPGDEPSAENNVASLLKKRELPKEENNQTEQTSSNEEGSDNKKSNDDVVDAEYEEK